MTTQSKASWIVNLFLDERTSGEHQSTCVSLVNVPHQTVLSTLCSVTRTDGIWLTPKSQFCILLVDPVLLWFLWIFCVEPNRPGRVFSVSDSYWTTCCCRFCPCVKSFCFLWNQATLWTVSVFRDSSTRPWLRFRRPCCRLRWLPLARAKSFFSKSCRSAPSIKIIMFSTGAGSQFPFLNTSQYAQYDKKNTKL